jgi:NAD(P)H-hydrate epimerase
MFLTREQVREVDRRAIEEFGLPGVVLMENAGRGVAELLRSLGVAGQVAVCCGKGNNGGDGFVIARHLDNWGVPVRVMLFTRPEDLRGDAAIHFRVLQRAGLGVPVNWCDLAMMTLQQELAAAEWIVDALFGTGLTGALRPPWDRIVEAINSADGRRLAVDIPSGLDCDSGLPLGPTVRAEHTATFVAQKKGFANPTAREWLGQVHVLNIGVPRQILWLVTQSR